MKPVLVNVVTEAPLQNEANEHMKQVKYVQTDWKQDTWSIGMLLE